MRPGTGRCRYVGCSLLLALATAAVACQEVGGHDIVVQFREAAGLSGGEAVYLAGLRIGTCRTPSVTAGIGRVPVRLDRRNRDAVPDGTVFLIKPDPEQSSRKSLVGYRVGLSTTSSDSGTPTFRGASNEIELALLVGADKARALWSQVGR